MKNIIIEIYSKNNPKRGFLGRNLEEVKVFLEKLKIDKNYIDNILISLANQQTDLNKFPNIVLFLNDNNIITIDDFMNNQNNVHTILDVS